MKCCDCEEAEGVWEIHILRQYHGEYGKKCGLFCDACVILAIEGYHTGGGLVSGVIHKIVRKKFEKVS